VCKKFFPECRTKNGTKFIPGSINGGNFYNSLTIGWRREENNSVFHKKFELQKELKNELCLKIENEKLKSLLSDSLSQLENSRLQEENLILKEKVFTTESYFRYLMKRIFSWKHLQGFLTKSKKMKSNWSKVNK
jgi:hypothetical protein